MSSGNGLWLTLRRIQARCASFLRLVKAFLDQHPDCLLLVFFAGSTYAAPSPRSSPTEAVTLLGCFGVARLVRLGTDRMAVRSRLRLYVGAAILLSAAGIAGGLLSDANSQSYMAANAIRRAGPFDNPNALGLLASVGALCALGLALSVAALHPAGQRRPNHLMIAGCLMAIIGNLWVLGVSYSRGAWAATFVGVAAMPWGRLARLAPISAGPTSAVLKASVIVALGFIMAIASLPYLQNLSLVKRALSLLNIADSSWTNRLDAWLGSAWMLSDYPLLGIGWSGYEAEYRHWYMPDYLFESGAVSTNDAIRLACSIGVIPFLAFVAYVARRLTWSVPDAGDGVGSTAELLQRSLVRAIAIALMAGFLFNGGLLTPIFGSLFWISLELNVGPTPALAPRAENEQSSLYGVPRAMRYGSGQITKRGLGARHLVGISGALFAGGLFCLSWQHGRFSHIPVRITTDDGAIWEGRLLVRKDVAASSAYCFVVPARSDLDLYGRLLRNVADTGLAACAVRPASRGAPSARLADLLIQAIQRSGYPSITRLSVVFLESNDGVSISSLLETPPPELRRIIYVSDQWANARTQLGLNDAGPQPRNTAARPTLALIGGPRSGVEADAEARRWIHTAGESAVQTYRTTQAWTASNRIEAVRTALEHFSRGEIAADNSKIHIDRVVLAFPGGIRLLFALALILSTWRLRRLLCTNDAEHSTFAVRIGRSLWLLGVALVLARVAVGHEPAPYSAFRVVSGVGGVGGVGEEMAFAAAQAYAGGASAQRISDLCSLARAHRSEFYGQIPESTYLSHMLTPSSGSFADADVDLRFALWRFSRPLTKGTRSPLVAADRIVSMLRRRLIIAREELAMRSLAEAWGEGVVSATEFESLYVEALRSVGVAAKVGVGGRAIILNDGIWGNAPRPLLLRPIGI